MKAIICRYLIAVFYIFTCWKIFEVKTEKSILSKDINVYLDVLPKCMEELGLSEEKIDKMTREDTNCIFACQIRLWNLTDNTGRLDNHKVSELLHEYPKNKLDEYSENCGQSVYNPKDSDENKKKFKCQYARCLLDHKFHEEWFNYLWKKFE